MFSGNRGGQMPTGTPVSRHCILILKDGTGVVDWGNNRYQDLMTGDFLSCTEEDVSRMASNEDLEALKHSECLEKFDEFQVFLYTLPEWDQPRLE
jgi:hypothetical protein